VSDEFPTLEAALGVSILVLGWRLALLVKAVRNVALPAERGAARPGRSKALDQAAGRAVRARGRVGADVAIAAVLGGALIYARAANFEVGAAFYLLGGVAFVLLLVSALVDARLDRALSQRVQALARDPAPRAAAGREDVCGECGAAERTRLGGSEELGPKLSSLGVDALWLCRKCGNLEGRARAGTW
jgi:hypothetical protein